VAEPLVSTSGAASTLQQQDSVARNHLSVKTEPSSDGGTLGGVAVKVEPGLFGDSSAAGPFHPVPHPCHAIVAAPDVHDTCQALVATSNSSKEEPWGSQPAEVPWLVEDEACSLGGESFKLPRILYEKLYGYQRLAISWMWHLFRKEFGGILADEMGLGKTVQTAAFLAGLKLSGHGSRFLVVVPVTLIAQWRVELGIWAKDAGLAIHLMHGNDQERRKAMRGMAARGGVMLISHDLVRTHIGVLKQAGLVPAAHQRQKKRKRKNGVRDDDSLSEAEDELPEQLAEGEGHDWDMVVVDEAHRIKNPSCQVGRALRRLESRSRMLLTGTPLQNSLTDLWALMDFAQPGLLGNHATFERNFSEQIARGSKRNASSFHVELKNHLARELRQLTAPHFLRRLKSEVCLPASNLPAHAGGGLAATSLISAPIMAPEKLPKKTDVVLWLSLTQAQRELYDLYLGSDMVRRATGERKIGMEALRAIAVLKKLCNHPLLCLSKEEFNAWRMRTAPPVRAGAAAACTQDALVASLPQSGVEDDDGATVAENAAVTNRLRSLVPDSVQGAALLSCKLRVLSILLPQLQRRGHKAIIFSQSTRMLDLIQSCVLRPLALRFLRVDGMVEPKDRDLKLQKFQAEDSKYFCLCMSMQVGGVGLTITAADRVILVDPSWNPAMDAQAVDRAHRIGQKRDVVVYRLISSGAIEDKMFRLQIFKRGLEKIAFEHEQQMRLFTNKELKSLFEPPNQASSTQALMAEQLGTEALEHEGLVQAMYSDIGGTDDPQALQFWQSTDVLGFSDYAKLFEHLGQMSQQPEEEAVEKAKALASSLLTEDYVKDQVVEGKLRRNWESKENTSPQTQRLDGPSAVMPLQN